MEGRELDDTPSEPEGPSRVQRAGQFKTGGIHDFGDVSRHSPSQLSIGEASAYIPPPLHHVCSCRCGGYGVTSTNYTPRSQRATERASGPCQLAAHSLAVGQRIDILAAEQSASCLYFEWHHFGNGWIGGCPHGSGDRREHPRADPGSIDLNHPESSFVERDATDRPTRRHRPGRRSHHGRRGDRRWTSHQGWRRDHGGRCQSGPHVWRCHFSGRL